MLERLFLIPYLDWNGGSTIYAKSKYYTLKIGANVFLLKMHNFKLMMSRQTQIKGQSTKFLSSGEVE